MNQKTLESLALALVIVLLPSNWFFVLETQSAYVHGLQVDYLLPKIYASLLAATIFIAISFTQEVALLKKKLALSAAAKLGLLLWLALGIRQLATTTPLPNLWFWLQPSIICLFALKLYSRRSLLLQPIIRGALVVSICFQWLVGLYQFFFQKAVAGYWLLGEPLLGVPVGLATTTLSGKDITLAYGTTPHPNVLAGVIVGLSIVAYLTATSRSRVLVGSLAVVVCGTTLLITQSLSATLLFFSGVVFVLKKQWLENLKLSVVFTWIAAVLLIAPLTISLAAETATNPSILRRTTLNQGAIALLEKNWLWGGGVFSFTRQVESALKAEGEVVRFLQPAHHTPLLLATELGTLFLLGCLVLLKNLSQKNKKRVTLTLLLLQGPLVLDHYLYTLPQGSLLVAVIFGGIVASSKLTKQARAKATLVKPKDLERG